MPWTVNDPPPPAKKWPTAQKRRCVAAANAALKDGKTDEEAVRACIGAAKRKAQMTEPETKDKSYGEDAFVLSVVPMGATTFGEVEEYEKSEETAERVHELTRQFQTLAGNVLYSETIPDKGGALKALVDELDGKLGEVDRKSVV